MSRLRTARLIALSLLAGAAPSAAAAASTAEPEAIPWETRRQDYFFAGQPAGSFTASNPAHGIRIQVDGAGLTLSPRDGVPGRPLRLEFRLPAPAARLTPVENRIDLSWDTGTGSLWNHEQGLILELSGHPDVAGRLLELGHSGGLRPGPGSDGAGLRFAGELPGFQVELRLGAVREPGGALLAAGWETGPGWIAGTLDDPVSAERVDLELTLVSALWTADGDRGGARLGFSVATAGDVDGDGYSDVVVGAHFHTSVGRALLYRGSPSGPSASPDWIFEGEQDGERMGWVVAPAGDVNGDGFDDVLVSAERHDDAFTDEGRCLLFLGSAAGLEESPAWETVGGQDNAWYGHSASTAGDVNGDGFDDILVGSKLYDDTASNQGRIFLYLGSAAGPGTTPDWTADGVRGAARLGTSVGFAGDVNGDGFDDVLAGAEGQIDDQADEGAAYLFLGSAAGPSAAPDWEVRGGAADLLFGGAVFGAGDVNGDGFADVAVGAPGFDGAATDEGALFVYHGGAPGPSVSADWTFQGDQELAELGAAVATAGDINGDGLADLVVGAPAFDAGEIDEGAAFVFLGSPAGLEEAPFWTLEGNQESAELGIAAASAGDVDGDGFGDLIVGMHLFDDDQTNEGRALVYTGLGSVPGDVDDWHLDGELSDGRLGWATAGGDVNGDGFGDLIVGMPGFTLVDVGRVRVFHGSPGGFAAAPDCTFPGEQAGARFGFAVDSAGDVNNDGYDDVIVGSYLFSNDLLNEGRAFVFHGSPAGLCDGGTPVAAWTVEGNQAGAELGRSVAGAGDVNGDGFADVIVGAPLYDQPVDTEENEGRIFVYLGSEAGLETTPHWIGQSNQAEAQLGDAVGGAGDVNGDGFGDVVAGAPLFDRSVIDEGAAFLWLGGPAGLGPDGGPGNADWTADANLGNAEFGSSVSGAGDVNGDGFSDVVVGSYRFQEGEATEGAAFLYLGSAEGPDGSPAWSAQGDQVNAWFGWSVGGAGDVNGDGYGDLVVGARRFEDPGAPGEPDLGSVFLYLGSALGPPADADWSILGVQTDAQLGSSVTSPGDANGDGFADVAAGAFLFDPPGLTDAGRVMTWFGNGRPGLDRLPRQARADDTGPIALLGRSDSETGFRLRARGRTAAGRGSVRLQWEVEPLGSPFDGQGLQEGLPLDTGAPVAAEGSRVELNEAVDGLDPRFYRWRLRAAGDSPFFPHTRWLGPALNSPGETDLRLAGCIAMEEVCDGIDNDCSGTIDDVPPPEAEIDLTAGVSLLSWTAGAGATAYDVVRGDLTVLRSGGGDFTAATEECLADDWTGTDLGYVFEPTAGAAAWFLVRPVNCAGPGSYETGLQVLPRDGGIDAAPGSCP